MLTLNGTLERLRVMLRRSWRGRGVVFIDVLRVLHIARGEVCHTRQRNCVSAYRSSAAPLDPLRTRKRDPGGMDSCVDTWGQVDTCVDTSDPTWEYGETRFRRHL